MATEPIVKNVTKTEKAVETIKSSFGWLGVGLIAGAYLAFSFLTIEERDATVIEILLRTAMSFLVGFSINRMLDIQGINAGLSTEGFIDVDREHFNATQRLGKDRGKLRRYTNYLNKEALKDSRSTILSYEGLSYEEYFDQKGKFIGKIIREQDHCSRKGIDKFQLAEIRAHNDCVRKAISHKVTQLSPQSLLSDDVKILDPNYQGQTIGEYTTKSIGKDTLAKLAPAIIVGRIGVGFVDGADGASFLFAALELSLYVLMGFIKYYGAFRFITTRYKQRIINKTLQLQGIKDWEDPEEVRKYGENQTRTDVTESEKPSGDVETTTDDSSVTELPSGPTSVVGTTTYGLTANSDESSTTGGTILSDKPLD